MSRGRNLAIQAARGDIIAVTDAGVVLANDWLQHLTQPFDNPAVQVVSGFFEADVHTPFEVAMGATVLPLVDEVNPSTFLPSSRSVAFRKSAWEKVGGYPEWLDYCEDLIFDLRLKLLTPLAFAPRAVAHFRPRGSLRAFWKQYFLYARGDGKADLWRKRHAIRYATYCVAAPVIALFGAVFSGWFWWLYLFGAAYYFYQPYKRLPVVLRGVPKMSLVEHLYIIALIPMIRVVGDVAKMTGYPVGWRWRLQNNPPDWKQVVSR
ncbi:MAG: glycosyltransferase [Anaerolineae bacterium]